MKTKKSNFLLNTILCVSIIVILFYLRTSEGFNTKCDSNKKSITKTIDLYFNLDSLNKPSLAVQYNYSGITVDSASVGSIVLNIPSTMPSLKGFTGNGWAQVGKTGKWQALTKNLDLSPNGFTIESNNKKLRLCTYSRKPNPNEVLLPQKVTKLKLLGLIPGIFGVVSNDNSGRIPMIWVQLMF